jgi:drug/metabolite transporter (DMT)-like permease
LRPNTSRSTDLGLLFVVLIWGLSPSIFKIAFTELEPLAFVFVRFLLLSALSLVVLFVRGRRGGKAWRIARADVPLLIVSGLSGYGFYQLFYMIGLAHTTVFASALCISTVPIWTLVILAVLKTERVHPVQWAGIALSLVGLAGFLLAATGRSAEVPHIQHLTSSDLLLGNLLSLAAGTLFALYGVTNKRLTSRYSPPELMCYTLLVGTLALAPFGIPALLSQPWQHVTWRTLLIVPYSVLFPIYLTNCATLLSLTRSPSGGASWSTPRSGSRIVPSARGVWPGAWSVISVLSASNALRFSA